MPTSLTIAMPPRRVSAENTLARHPLVLQALLLLLLSGVLVAISLAASGNPEGSARAEIAGP